MDQQQQESLALNTKARAARKLGVSYSTMVRWIRDGKIKTVKVGGRTWVPDETLIQVARGDVVIPPKRPTPPSCPVVTAPNPPADAPAAGRSSTVADYPEAWRAEVPIAELGRPKAALAPAPTPSEPQRRGILSRFTGA